MQALGAYGFLSIHRGKPSFRAHVAPALTRLQEALANLHPDDRLDELAEVLKNLKPELSQWEWERKLEGSSGVNQAATNEPKSFLKIPEIR
jgi:hypothetical protein